MIVEADMPLEKVEHHTWRAVAQRLACMSQATTLSAPAFAAMTASTPEPVPKSST